MKNLGEDFGEEEEQGNLFLVSTTSLFLHFDVMISAYSLTMEVLMGIAWSDQEKEYFSTSYFINDNDKISSWNINIRS